MQPPRPTTTGMNGAMSTNKRLLIISLLLVIIAFMAYSQVTHCDFVSLDDDEYVAKNGNIQDGLTVEGIIWAFTTDHASNWRPLTWISHMADVQLFGLCCQARSHSLPRPAPLLCLRLDGETYARHPPVCPAPSRLLAPSALRAKETISGGPETLFQR